MIRLSDNLSLPLDAVTQTFGILAVRGAGKSNTAGVMAEEMFRNKLPFCAIDPVGAWWGLRSSADGKGPGLAIPVFGGRHGDVPLEKAAGNMIADLVVDDRLSCVLDCSEFSEGDKIRFLIDFSERLYRRNQDPLHLFLEEADDYVPQRPFREQARLLRAWENIVRRGRARGLGITMITQRSAAINKNVLTQIETLIALRTTAPNDRKAIEAWVDYHGQGKEMLASLPELGPGEGWVWSPSWLKIFKRVQFRRRSTFDSGATPKDLKGKRPPATLADVDLAGITKKMQATIERAKLEDPRELTKQIAELRRQLAARPAEKVPEPVEVPVPMISAKDLEELGEMRDQVMTHANLAAEWAQKIAVQIAGVEKAIAEFKRPAQRPGHVPIVSKVPNVPLGRSVGTARGARLGTNGTAGRIGAADLPVGEKKILVAIAQHGSVERDQLTVLTGYKRSSRDTYLQRLQQRGFVGILGSGAIEATNEGLAALGNDYEPLPTGDELRQYWLNRLPLGEMKILAEIVRMFPKAVDREQLSKATGYLRSSRDTYLQRLQSRRLVESVGRGDVRASENLFGA